MGRRSEGRRSTLGDDERWIQLQEGINRNSDASQSNLADPNVTVDISSPPMCRICLCEEFVTGASDNAEAKELLRPCLCSGTHAYVHRGCLDRWRIVSRDPESFRRCRTCRAPYILLKADFDDAAIERKLRGAALRDAALLACSALLLWAFFSAAAAVGDKSSHHAISGALSAHLGTGDADAGTGPRGEFYVLLGFLCTVCLGSLLGLCVGLARCLCRQDDGAAYGCCVCCDAPGEGPPADGAGGDGAVGCDGDGGDGGVVIFIILLVVLVAGGLFFGVYFACKWVWERAQFRRRKLRLSEMAQFEMVLDRDDPRAPPESRDHPLPGNTRASLGGRRRGSRVHDQSPVSEAMLLEGP